VKHIDEDPHKSLRLLQMVEEECRRAGGRHLLTPEEYLQIVNYCYQQVYDTDRPADQQAGTG